MLNYNNEIWKPIRDFESLYEVSNFGRVKNKKGKLLSTSTMNAGYQDLQLSKSSKRTHKLLHRVVAEAFCEKPNDCTEVHHKDEDKTNNMSTNLEWVTSSQNKQYSIESGTYNKIFTTKSTLGVKHKVAPGSKYHNVSWDKRRQKWQASIRHNKKTYFQKRFLNEEDAALHVNWIIDELGLIDRPKNII